MPPVEWMAGRCPRCGSRSRGRHPTTLHPSMIRIQSILSLDREAARAVPSCLSILLRERRSVVPRGPW
eukprot:12918971-Prorocentrum_lima.AAC.1